LHEKKLCDSDEPFFDCLIIGQLQICIKNSDIYKLIRRMNENGYRNSELLLYYWQEDTSAKDPMKLQINFL
jgi:hypothetical protein